MLTSAKCFKRYGDPVTEKHMIVWVVPPGLSKVRIPKKIYCNKDMVAPLTEAFFNVVDRGLSYAVHTFDGCFNIRSKRGSKTMSLHSWGVAIDINSATNPMGEKSKLVTGLVECFKDAGFDWGGDWAQPDAQHFQLKG